MKITDEMITAMAEGRMRVIKRVYIVYQGVLSKSGDGTLDGPIFSTKKEAIQYFNRIKNDTKGWTSHGILTTLIEEAEWNSEEENYFNDIAYIIKDHEKEV